MATFHDSVGNVVIPTFFFKGAYMMAKAENGHVNVKELFKLNL
jgi:hypothetical protein